MRISDWSSDVCSSDLARVSADNPLARGKADFAFAMSDWDEGIEPWRLNVPTNSQSDPSIQVHTVYDRPLFHVGETVSMKHFIRVETRDGLRLPGTLVPTPDHVVIAQIGRASRWERRCQSV